MPPGQRFEQWGPWHPCHGRGDGLPLPRPGPGKLPGCSAAGRPLALGGGALPTLGGTSPQPGPGPGKLPGCLAASAGGGALPALTGEEQPPWWEMCIGRPGQRCAACPGESCPGAGGTLGGKARAVGPRSSIGGEGSPAWGRGALPARESCPGDRPREGQGAPPRD